MEEVNKLIFVDYLEMSFDGVLPIKTPLNVSSKNIESRCHINEHCYIEFKYGGTKIFQRIGELWIDQVKIGELRFSPRSPFLNANLINFKFENEILYQQGYTEIIDTIIRDINLNFLYISRLDVTIDCIDHNLLKFVDNYLFKTSLNKDYSIRHKGKVKRDNIRTNVDSRLYWGSQESDKYVKIYNKTRELDRPNCNKDYIPRFWLENGMAIEGKVVERFELTLKQRHAKLLDYRELADTNYLASIMETHCKNFEFEQTYTNHRKKRKRNVTPIKYDGFKTVLLPKFKYEKSHSLFTEKRTLKKLYLQYLLSEFIASDDYVATGYTYVPEVVKNYPDFYGAITSLLYQFPQLEEYFNKKKGGWEREFIRTNKVATGKISIDDFVQSLHVKPDKVGNSHEMRDTLGLLSFKINDIQLADLEGKCKSIELKGNAEGRS